MLELYMCQKMYLSEVMSHIKYDLQELYFWPLQISYKTEPIWFRLFLILRKEKYILST